MAGDEFEAQMNALLGNEWEALHKALTDTPPTSIRLNPAKGAVPPSNARPVPWTEGLGWYLPTRPSFTSDPRFHAGAYYVQEASSMFVGWLARRAMQLDTHQWHSVIDLCAAPGGKTTHLLSILPSHVLVVANEVISNRWTALHHNVARWGYANLLLTCQEVASFAPLRTHFDLVVVDAPCSGEGLFRKMPQARQMWSSAQVDQCAIRQSHILQQAMALVRPVGWLIYSTCTWNRKENECQVVALEQAGFEVIDLPLDSGWNVVWSGKGWRFYPHRVQGEGFFAALLRKKGGTTPTTGIDRASKRSGKARLQRLSPKQVPTEWCAQPEQFDWYIGEKGMIYALPHTVQSQASLVLQHIPSAVPILAVGRYKGTGLIPAPELALATNRGEVPAVSVDRAVALALLRGETPKLEIPYKGWILVKYEGLGLCWIKHIGQRINNYLPKGWRIRHL